MGNRKSRWDAFVPFFRMVGQYKFLCKTRTIRQAANFAFKKVDYFMKFAFVSIFFYVPDQAFYFSPRPICL